MTRAYYSTGFGLAGCYLDDSQGGAHCYSTRRDLAEAIRAELQAYDLPAYLFAEVGIRRLWRAIANAGSASSFTFHIHHGANVLTFYGLTEREYLEAELEAAREWTGYVEEAQAALDAYDARES